MIKHRYINETENLIRNKLIKRGYKVKKNSSGKPDFAVTGPNNEKLDIEVKTGTHFFTRDQIKYFNRIKINKKKFKLVILNENPDNISEFIIAYFTLDKIEKCPIPLSILQKPNLYTKVIERERKEEQIKKEQRIEEWKNNRISHSEKGTIFFTGKREEGEHNDTDADH
jgi:hypothetical protein